MTEMTEREKRVGLHLPLEARGEEASGAPFSEKTRSLNISGGGILFESQHNLLVGSHLTLAIEVPPALRKHFADRAVYRARAVVCRVERFEGEPVSRVGARFLGEVEA
jgi:c-di-GMP-binding flagellar brake protein YcgR